MFCYCSDGHREASLGAEPPGIRLFALCRIQHLRAGPRCRTLRIYTGCIAGDDHWELTDYLDQDMVGPDKLRPSLLVAWPLPGYLRCLFAFAEFHCSRGCTILFGFKVDSAHLTLDRGLSMFEFQLTCRVNLAAFK